MSKTDTSKTESSLSKREAALPEGVESTHAGPEYLPSTDIYETEDHVVIVADLPGVGPDNVDIALERNLLTLRGRVEQNPPSGDRLPYSEYEIGDCVRSFRLTGEIDRDRIEARTKNGILTVTLPKVGAASRRIEVTTE